MPKLVHSLEFIVRRKKPTGYQLSTTNWRFWRPGFTIIELLIVISLFGLAASLITASYLTFERNQRVKSAALMLKSDLRLVQSKALSGDKSYSGDSLGYCDRSIGTLVGWYMRVSAISGDNTGYKMGASCLSGGNETSFDVKSISFARGVTITNIDDSGISYPAFPIYVLYRPLTNGITYSGSSFPIPPFLDVNGNCCKYQLSNPPDILTIHLTGPQGGLYNVQIGPSGEVNEVKP